MIGQIIFWVITAFITFKVWMKLIRLMEIKERQLRLEMQRNEILVSIREHQSEILKVLKGRKDGKRKISRKN